jgi:enamine deaminase RidA (YjgF/YER057c/UK114 family)
MSNSLAERARTAHAPINPWTWQKAFGYSQAIDVRHTTALLYCAGQAAIASDGTVIGPGDLRTQLAASLDNLEMSSQTPVEPSVTSFASTSTPQTWTGSSPTTTCSSSASPAGTPGLRPRC